MGRRGRRRGTCLALHEPRDEFSSTSEKPESLRVLGQGDWAGRALRTEPPVEEPGSEGGFSGSYGKDRESLSIYRFIFWGGEKNICLFAAGHPDTHRSGFGGPKSGRDTERWG